MPVCAPLVLDDTARVGLLGAELIANRLRAEPGLRVLLPTGDGMGGLYAALDGHAADGSLPTDRAELLGPDDHERIAERPLDLAVLGMDNGGAIGVSPHAVWDARAIVVLAAGLGSAIALRDMLERPSPTAPASLLRDHPRLTLICDRAAASALRPAPAWSSDRALVVLGHREPGVSAEHRISDESRARLRHAADIARDEPVRAAVLTGWTRVPHGLSEAEQMLTAWNDPDTPALLEVAGRNTAENASRSLPLLLASGAIRRVTVVTSAWHVRAAWFFRPYRHHGLQLDFSPVVTPLSRWGPLLGSELRGLPAAPRQRSAAYRAMRLP
jgi:uncharacterized SAM-binding protein YcdF (DUF218 family)